MSNPVSAVETVCGNPNPGQPKAKEQTICLTNDFYGSCKVCVDVKVSKVEAYLKSIKPNEVCERTQPTTEREPTRTYNRVYVDLDGNLPNLAESEFDSKIESIRNVLMGDILGHEHSLMESCKWKMPDEKSNIINKMSWRITLTHLHGTKEQIEQFVRSKLYPHFKKVLLTTIPVVLMESGEKNKKDTPRKEGVLEVDMSVYGSNRKMRMCYQSKPHQGRPNRLVMGEFVDTLITYIPSNSVLMPKSVKPMTLQKQGLIEAVEEMECDVGSTITTTTGAYHEPTEDEAETHLLLIEVVKNLAQSRFDYQPYWIRLGFVLYNENFTVEELIELSKRSKHWRVGESPSWIKSQWSRFRKSRLTQSTLWRWLSEDNPEVYQELVGKRKDFWQMMNCMSHAEVAQFFYNMKPDSYTYHEDCGWYQLADNNRWELYEKLPSMLKSDIWNTLKRVAKEHIQNIPVPEKPEDPEDESYKAEQKAYKQKLKTVMKFITSVGTSGFDDGVIAFLPSMYKDDNLLEKMDENRHLFAFQDKVLDLNTMTARLIEPTDYICINTGYDYPETRYPEERRDLIKCLRSIFETSEEELNPEMGEMTRYALEHISCCLNGTNKYERFYVWTGKGGNGKGVLSEIVKRAFGQYYHPIPHSILTKVQDKKDAPCPPLAKSKGKRFVQFSEPEADDKFQVGTIKEITGGDEITARDMYKSTITFKPQFGTYGQTNNIPKLNRADGGAQRRFRIIPFKNSFVNNPTEPFHKLINVELKDKIVKNEKWRNEFIWLLIEAYQRVVKHGLKEPAETLEASRDYMEDNNPVGSWLRSNYTTGLDPNNNLWWLSASEVLKAYQEESTSFQISAERFKGMMILCEMEQKRVSHDFATKVYDDYSKEYIDETKKAGRYWVGIRKIGQPPN